MSSIRESGASWLRLAVRRMGDERGLVGAAFLVALVAATVAAACVVYPDAALRRGLLDVLAGADPAASSVEVASDVEPGAANAFDAEVTAALAGALGPAADPLVRTARSEAWQLPGGSGLEHPPLTYLAWDEGLGARTRLVAGTAAGTAVDGRPEAVVTSAAAAALGVAPGDVLDVASRLDPSRRLEVRIAGIVDVLDPADPAWGGDPLATDGVAQPGSFPLRGPLFVDRATLLEVGTVSRASLAWRALPAFERIGPDDLAAIRAGVAGLQRRLEDRVGNAGPITVATGLPAILDAAGAGVATGRSGTALIALQLLLLAAYALVLLAALVVERRRASTELAAARGAPAAALLGLAALEGVLVALPAVLLGPALAVGLATLLGAAWGGVAEPRVTPAAVALAAAAGAVAVVGMVLPTAASLGPVARLRGALAGRGSSGLAERTGIDLALLVLAALGLWQLREAGTVLASSRAGGGAAVDPLLAVAPAIGLLAGGLVALRLGPLVAAWLERAAGRTAGVVAPLAGHGIARRSAEGARAALLLVVATGIVLFATAYSRTWQQSQRDQVAAAIPADLVGEAAAGPAAPSAAATRGALLAAAGVREAVPAVRETFAVGTAVRQGVLLAVPADVPFAPPAALAADLASARPAVTTLPLPDRASSLRLALDVRLVAVPGEGGILRPIPGAWTGLGTAVVVRDERGLLHRVPGATGRVAGGGQELEVPLGDLAAERPGGGPLEIVAVETALTLPEGVSATGVVRLAGITAVDGSGDAVAVDAGPARRAWGAVRSTFGAAPVPVPAGAGDPLAVELAEPVTGPVPVVVGFRPVELAAVAAAPLAAVADAATRDAAGVAVGDVLPLQRGTSATLPVRLAGVADVLPGATTGGTAGSTGAVVVDLPTLALVDYGRDGAIPAQTEWWLDVDDGAEAGAEAAMAAAGLDRIRVRAAVERDRLDDPLARGTLGALGLAAGAAVVFAVVGFGAAAWRAARVRRTERAVARALGLERGRTAAWLGLELAFQLAVGVAGGIALGLVLAWAVLPSVSLTPDGSAPVPAPVVVPPWDVAGLAIAAGIAGLAAAMVPLRRAGRPGALADDLREAAP